MSTDKLKHLIDDLPAESELRDEFLDVMKFVRKLKDEKSDLNNRNQELLKLLQEEQRRRDDLSIRVQINRITGLPNHNRMAIDLEEILKDGREYLEEHRGAILFLRLDKTFATIQSTLKPQMTEWILYQIARRIKDATGENARIYHSREDEFLVLIQDNSAMKQYFSLGRRLRQEVRKPHVLSGYNIHIDCHIGIALFPQHGLDKGLLLQNADIALQVAEERRQDIMLFHNKLREQVVEKMELQNSILRALEQQAIQEIGKQFEIYYQPILKLEEGEPCNERLNLKDSGGWRIKNIGAEALIRWHHPNKGTIAPDRFIPLAEETGLIVPIGNWIIYNVADQIRRWKDRGLNLESVSVNISPRQFSSDTFLHAVKTAMDNNRLTSEIFRFEITETNLAVNPEEMIKTMWQLHDEEIFFYIDDFGTGYSSLSYVHQMPVKKIKIDKSFVLNLSDNPKEKTIIRTIIAMAKELGFGLVAEGVEEVSQLSYLLKYGVRNFQGYYFSRPLTAEKFEEFLISACNDEDPGDW